MDQKLNLIGPKPKVWHGPICQRPLTFDSLERIRVHLLSPDGECFVMGVGLAVMLSPEALSA